MAYKFFDKRYLVTPDDRDIIGKRVFYADRIQDIIKDVESGDFNQTGILEDIFLDNFGPAFATRDADSSGSVRWGLVYYDPNYECKVAYSQGKQIQSKRSFIDKWSDTPNPRWHDYNEYRVKPDKWFVHEMSGGKFYKDNSSDTYVEFEGTEEECDIWIAEHTSKTRRMTNKELSRWLAEGNGERLDVTTKYVSAHYVYTEGEDDEECDEEIRIREWNTDQWHEPLVEVKE